MNPPNNTSKATPARLMALKVTSLVRKREAFVNELIETHIYPAKLTAREHGFAVLISRGVVATCGELDILIDMALGSDNLKPALRDAIRISVFEIVFLSNPPHVTVHQGVEMARSLDRYCTGFANKLLRKIVDVVKEFPFGDAKTSVIALAHEQAYPLWLAQRFVDDMGFGAAAKFMRACNKPSPLFVFELATDTCRLVETASLKSHMADIESGKLVVVDASALAVARFAAPLDAGAYLELGSGRGTKTILLANYVRLRDAGKKPTIYALDNHQYKQQIVGERLKLHNLDGVSLVCGDGLKLDSLIASEMLPQSFSGALIDTPCSGTGTLRRHPEIRWRLSANDVSAMAAQSLEFLNAVAGRIKLGGFIVYATCSALKEENEQVIEAFLSGDIGKNFKLSLDMVSDYVDFTDTTVEQRTDIANYGSSTDFVIPVDAAGAASVASGNAAEHRNNSADQISKYYTCLTTCAGAPDTHFAVKLVRSV